MSCICSLSFSVKYPIRTKIVVNNTVGIQVKSFKYIDCDISFDRNKLLIYVAVSVEH